MPRPLRVPAVPHYLAIVRAALGLTQAQLAGALGVSRGLVTKVEAGQRTLPAVAGPALAWLARGLPPGPLPAAAGPGAAPAPGASPAPALAPAPAGRLRTRLAAAVFEALKLSRRLARGQGRAHRARQWLQASPALLAALPAAAGPQRLWLAAVGAEAEEALEGEGCPGLHQLLAARLAGLHAEIEALRADLGDAAP